MEVMSLTLDVESLAKINANVQYCEISRYAPGTTDKMRDDMILLCEKLFEQAEFVFAYVLAFVGKMVGGITQHQAFLYGCVWIGIALVLVALNHFKNYYKHYQEIA